MPVAHRFKPLEDARWSSLVERHPSATLFHSRAWLQALSSTYNYSPIGYTTSGAGQELRDGIVFCSIESWLTGRRLVSLPFSDHCQPLVDRDEDIREIFSVIETEIKTENWRYVETRPTTELRIAPGLIVSNRHYALFEIDLRLGLEAVFASLHKDSTQRKIRRAERENLRYEEGCEPQQLNAFYRLLVRTRQRHGLPPQPKAWFENLIHFFGKDLKIRIASKDKLPVAGILTIAHKEKLTYKYGGSDSRYNALGGMHLLLWKAIEDAKALGLKAFDMGRADLDQPGLLTFKRRWGARESVLRYSRFTLPENQRYGFRSESSGAMRHINLLGYLPGGVVSLLGRVLYKHVG